MTEPITLPPGVAIGILAFLLSLLPAGLFMWLWYLRRHERAVPAAVVVKGFLAGIALVIPAFYLEKMAPGLWARLSPATAHYFDGAILPLLSWQDVIFPAVGTFLVVALVEEGVRYGALWWWFRRSAAVDQVFDGLIIGVAAGLGFATLENALYFFQLFSAGMFNTLVFVFFLRFLISTLAHISFGGIMGVLLARGVFSVYRPGLLYAQAFLIPWFLHGLYDWLLGVDQTLYAVLLLLPPLAILIIWSNRRDFFILHRENGKILVSPKLAPEGALPPTHHPLKKFETPWNSNAPWLGLRRIVPKGRKSAP